MSDATIAFDIEVAGHLWEDVDEITRGYLLERARDERERDAVPERTALVPGLGKIIAIGLWNVEAERGLVLLEGESGPQREWERVAHSDVFRGEEEELLRKFWEVVGRKRPRLVSYNGRCYDGPMLMIAGTARARPGRAPPATRRANRRGRTPARSPTRAAAPPAGGSRTRTTSRAARDRARR